MMRWLGALLLSLWLASAAQAQVALDATGHCATTSVTSSDTSLSCSFTVGSGTNRALGAALIFGEAPAPTITAGPSYAGTAMTAVTGAAGNNTGLAPPGTSAIVWYALTAPTSGSNTFTLSWTGGHDLVVMLISFTGVNQAGGTTSFAHGNAIPNGTGATTTLTITSAANNMTVAAWGDDGGTLFSSTSATQDFINITTGGGASNGALNHTAGAASVNMTATLATQDNIEGAGFDVVAAAGGGGPTCPMTRSLMGVGC